MPLTRDTVTVASRIMLPTYVALFATLGLIYLGLDDNTVQESPALSYADAWMPIDGWGFLFVAVAVLMASALTTHNRGLYRYALLVCIVALGIWSGVFALAAYKSTVSPSVAVWPAFAAVACYASYRSLSAGEVA